MRCARKVSLRSVFMICREINQVIAHFSTKCVIFYFSFLVVLCSFSTFAPDFKTI